jgi:hypothetical protein
MANKPKTKIEEVIQPVLDPEGNIIGAKTYEQPDQINVNFVSDDEELALREELNNTVGDGLEEINKKEIEENIIHYASELYNSLEGIYIGGHAEQIRGMLGVSFSQYRNL